MFDQLLSILTVGGLFGVAALMLAENIFPPIPSELVMPLAGFLAAKRELNLLGVILARERRRPGRSRRLVRNRIVAWGGAARPMGQAVGPVADPLAIRHRARSGGVSRVWTDGRAPRSADPGREDIHLVPAGVSRMAIAPFLLWSALGTGLWTALLAYAGYRLERHYDRVATWIDRITQGVMAVCFATYLYRVATFCPDPADRA
jgi:hypothetical protein